MHHFGLPVLDLLCLEPMQSKFEAKDTLYFCCALESQDL